MSLVEDIYQSESESESEANEAEHSSPLSPDDGEVEDADADSLGKLTLGTYEEVTHRILSSEDSVEMLQLPLPTLDPLGKVVWQVEFSDIRRRFRKLSRFVHPDKNKSPEAVQAFAKLQDAVRFFKDPVQKKQLLKALAEKQAKLDKHKWMSADDVQGVLKSEREKRLGAVEMMKDESRKLHKEVLKQMNKKKKKRLQERTDDADYFAADKRRKRFVSSMYTSEEKQEQRAPMLQPQPTRKSLKQQARKRMRKRTLL